MPERIVELSGHIIDSGTMERCFALVMDMGGHFEVEQFDVGRDETETSYCRLRVVAEDEALLETILHELHQNGAKLADPSDATLAPAPADRQLPRGFYSTTNHPTQVRHDGDWLAVANPEMDCAVVVEPDGQSAATKTIAAVEAGDLVVTGEAGIRVDPPDRPRDDEGPFGFMRGGVSSERPSESLIEQVAESVAETRADGGTVLAVVGPAVVHSGASEALATLVREGYVDTLSAGNGFAVHDIERNLYGTSLGMDIEKMEHPRNGHKHHLEAISEVSRAGSIPDAVAAGTVTDGVMYECVTNDVPYVLAGSIRDDGPLPDTVTDTVQAQVAIREQARDADLVLLLATLLHSVAIGNCLPSTTRTVCVDIDPSTVTQLLGRGSSQAVGVVTDVGTFLPTLVRQLETPGPQD